LYPYRWVICITFVIQQIGVGIGMVGYTTITPLVRDVYRVSNIATSLLVLSFTIAFIPLNFPANQLIESKGMSWPIRIHCFTVFVGAFVRLLLHQSFYFILLGQVIMALGQPFTLTIGAKMAGLWFGDHERALATTVTSIASVMGVILGFVFPVLMVPDDKDRPDIKDKIWFYTLVQSIVISVMALPVFFLVKNQPKTPPSKSAKDVLRMKKRRILESIRKLIRMPNYWAIVLAYSLVFSVYIVLGASVGAVSDEFKYGTSANSIFGGVFIIFGIIGSITNAVILDKFRTYKLQLIIIGIAA
jgi:hypothetical protein